MEPATTTDASLIAASLTEPRSFGPIFDRHFDAIHRYLARRAGRDVADDLSGDVFLIAFDQRLRYDTGRPDARPWLYGIATNLLRRHHRSAWRRLRAYARLGGRLGSEPSEADAVVGRLDAQALGPMLDRHLASLASRDRDVLLLFAWAELSYDEIAQALDLPVGTVKSRLHRARGVLREHVRASGERISD